MRHTTKPFLAAFVALTALACGSSAVLESPGPGAQPEDAAREDLFACALPPSCPSVCTHLSPGDCGAPDATQCTAELWLEGVAGVYVLEDRPGPGDFKADHIVIMLGDGTALRQTRQQRCDLGGCEPWELGVHERCEVVDPPETCEAGDCAAVPSLVDCLPQPTDWRCDDVRDALTEQ